MYRSFPQVSRSPLFENGQGWPFCGETSRPEAPEGRPLGRAGNPDIPERTAGCDLAVEDAGRQLNRQSSIAFRHPRMARARGATRTGEAASGLGHFEKLATRGLMMRTKLALRHECGGLAVVIADRRHRSCRARHILPRAASVERFDSFGIRETTFSPRSNSIEREAVRARSRRRR